MSPDQNNYSSIHASRKQPNNNVHRSHSHSKRALARPNRLEALRLAVFGLVLATSLIALALAAHFLTVLQANDLTHFIPFALFTSVASFIGMIALIAVVLVHKSKPAALKVELGIMAVTGILWLALSIFISTSPAESADVECFSDDGDLIELAVNGVDVPFDTQLFRAQYRVLTAVGSVNAFVLLILCAVLTWMVLRHFNRTRDWVSTTRKPLLGEKSRSKSKSRSNGRPAPPLTDLPKRVARKAFSVVSAVGAVHHSSSRKKEKDRGLPLPATTKSKTQTREKDVTRNKDSNVNANTNATGTRPTQSTPSRPPLASKAKTTPTPPPKSKPAPASKTPARQETSTSKARPLVVKSKSLPNTGKDKDKPGVSTSRVNPITPPPKAKVNNGAKTKSGAAPVARRKTGG